MGVRHQLSVLTILLAVGWCANAGLAQAQTVPVTDEVRAAVEDLSRHDAAGDCKFLDDFLDRNIRNPDSAGVAARFVAFDSLTRGKVLGASSKVRCLYHDRALALRVAIDEYEGQSVSTVLPPIGFSPEPSLEAALGRAWREKLAEAGVRTAAQDLIALHLSCTMKERNDTGAFWNWMVKGDKETARQGLERTLSSRAKSVPCTHMPAKASLEAACYWNLFEIRWAPQPEPLFASPEMREFLSLLTDLSRWQKLLLALIDYADQHSTTLQDPAVEAHFRSEVRKLIAAGCSAALPAPTIARLEVRAANGPTRTVDSVIAQAR